MDIYRELDMTLLDGMPCDRGRLVLQSELEDEVIWQYEAERHPFCNSIGEIKNPFDELREVILQGMLAGSGFYSERLGELKYRIRKGECA